MKSQNDWCIVNSVENVESFCILPKEDVSDHVPCAVTIKCKPSTSLVLMEEYANGLFSYDYYDKSDNLKPKIFIEKINVTVEFINELDNIADFIMINIEENLPNLDKLAENVDESLYLTCKSYCRKKAPVFRIPTEKSLCSSKNFHAIAHANIIMYMNLVESGVSTDVSLPYLMCWQENKKFAAIKEEDEYSVRKNKKWKYLAKTDTKAMWNAIDYNEKDCTSKNQDLRPEVIHKYFTDIFQANHLRTNPTVDHIQSEVDGYSKYNRLLDQEFTYDELNNAIRQSGKGIGLDGIDKAVSHLFPIRLRKAILEFFNTIFRADYPKVWTRLALRPEAKKGHSTENPKLRGVAVSSLLSSLYDIMLDNRFKCWYTPNPEQAGFRANQGCINQIFAIYLSIELANSFKESIFIGFIDYEKAFDYVNRFQIVKRLISRNAGAVFTRSVANMYRSTNYVPKISTQKMGHSIKTEHGVTQGRRSSTSLFSFAVSDIPKVVVINDSFLGSNNVLQLADDSTILTNSFNDLTIAFKQFIQESKENFMVTNYDKTFYLNISSNPVREPIQLSCKEIIHHADKDEHLYLGMWIIASNDIVQHIKCNLKNRAYNIKKYYDWLNINEVTPIQIKLRVLDCCLLAAYLYGCECWWKVDTVAPMLLAEERKMLKRILQVKSNTPDNIIYVELNRCDVVTKIKCRQYNFYLKFKQLNQEVLTARRILSLCFQLDICKYYESPQATLVDTIKDDMKTEIRNSNATYKMRYHDITGCLYNSSLYNEYMNENKRIVISRWRLSNHGLRIETGRYTTPKTPRNERICLVCPSEVEDEHHVVFICPLYDTVRMKHYVFISKYNCISKIFNPGTLQDAEELGSILLEIESIRNYHGL